MVSIAGCLVFSAQPALTYLRGKQGKVGGGGGGEEKEEEVVKEQGNSGGGDLLNTL